MVRFVKNSLLFAELNISHADIPCVLENDVGEATRSTPVTLYITVNVTTPDLYDDSTSSMPTKTKDDDSPAEEATITGHVQIPAPEHILPLSHHQPIGQPEGGEEMSPTTTKNPRLALHWADKVMKRIVPNDRSNTWEGAVGRIKWVMDTLGPIAEVRLMSL